MVDGVLLAIGGKDDDYHKTSAICAFHPVDQKWQHVGKMPFECSWVDSLLLSEGRLLVVDGWSQRVLKITVEGSHATNESVLTRVFSGLATLFPNVQNTDQRYVMCVPWWEQGRWFCYVWVHFNIYLLIGWPVEVQ